MFKTLKREEIYAHKYDDMEQLRTNIEEFIDEYYNRQRLHSALAYCSPEEFERKAEGQAENRGATIEVFVNNDNDEKITNGLLGTGTQMPSASHSENITMGLDASVRCNCIKEGRALAHPFPELLVFDEPAGL